VALSTDAFSAVGCCKPLVCIHLTCGACIHASGGLIHCCLLPSHAHAAGFYPRILRVEAPTKYQAVAGGAMRVEADPASIKFFERGLGRVWLHPASVCFKAGSYPSGGCKGWGLGRKGVV
jgi:hypothetical protein